jgi:hypothetical protein
MLSTYLFSSYMMWNILLPYGSQINWISYTKKVTFPIDQMNNYFFSKNWIRFLILKLYMHHLLWYCDINDEIISGVAYDNCDDFQHVKVSYFHKISFHYFGDYLMTKPTLGYNIYICETQMSSTFTKCIWFYVYKVIFF